MTGTTSTFDSRAFRDTLGCFATGVTIITAKDGDGAPVGLTANSFSSVSLDPPLVLFCLDRRAQSFDAFGADTKFVVNVLGYDQQDLSNRFAKSDPDKFDGVSFTPGANGAPVLPGCLATMECSVHSIADAGDHVVVIGQVTAIASTGPDCHPLLYYRGRYSQVAQD